MTTPATSNQVSYLRSLLAQHDVDAMLSEAGVDAEGFAAAMAQDKGVCSQAIDTIRRMPKRAAAVSNGPRANAYGGKCKTCGVYVAAQAGLLGGTKGAFFVTHKPGECPTPKAAVPTVEVAEGLYVSPSDASVWKVYMTQNGRLGVMVPDQQAIARRLAAKAAGETIARTKALVYVKGGLRLVGERAAANDLRLMTQEEARTFGRTTATCCNCGLPLDDDRSVAAGYGPVCADNRGWHYPSLAEAEAILGREAPQDDSPFQMVGSIVVEVDDPKAAHCEDCADPADVIEGVVCDACLALRRAEDEEPF